MRALLVPEIDPERCLRFRCNSFDCRRCEEACPQAAVKANPLPRVEAEACTGCGLCAAACPADGFRVGGPSGQDLAAALAQVERPVLGCLQGGAGPANARLGCLGQLTLEDLVGLALLTGPGLQLDGSACGGCQRGSMLPVLLERVAAAQALVGRAGLCLVTAKEDLRHRDRHCDRRSFFHLLGRGAATGAASWLRGRGEQPAARSVKRLPERRSLVLAARARAPETAQGTVHELLSYRAAIASHCDACPRCAALCPTGALVREKDDGQRRLVFDPDRCTGCGLCEHACPKRAVRIERPGGATELANFGQDSSPVRATG